MEKSWKGCDKLSGRCRSPASTPVQPYSVLRYKIILVDNSWSFGAFKLTDLGQWKNINIYFYYNGPTVSFLFYDFQNFSNVLKNNHYIATNAEECRKNNGPECLRQPKSGHFFIRVGSIDNTANLNLKVAEKTGEVNISTKNFSIEILFLVWFWNKNKGAREYKISETGPSYVDAQVSDIKIYGEF